MSASGAMATADCAVCFSTYAPYELVSICNYETHACCGECFSTWARGCFTENRPVTCPMAAECKYALTDDQLPFFFNRQEISEIFERRLRSELAGSNDYVACPAPHCPEYFFRGESLNDDHAECPTCKHHFCVRCLGVYHYHCTCADMADLRMRWIDWVRTGRDANTAERQKQHQETGEYAMALANHKNHQAAVLAAYDTFKADEEYKKKKCRHCPSCNKIVEKVEGCDSMRCGADYHTHGGMKTNQQSGCGAQFTWNSAPRYVGEELKDKTIEAFDRPVPGSSLAFHGLACSSCRKDIVGIRFQCVHCPKYDLCERCDAVTQHTPSHVFALHTTGLMGLANFTSPVAPVRQVERGTVQSPLPVQSPSRAQRARMSQFGV